MPKKHKRNAAKNPKQTHLVKLKAWLARRTSGEWIIAVVLLLGLVVVAKYPVSVLQEKLMYSAAEKEIDRFANQASAIAPSKVLNKNSCNYSSAKYNKGTLGCTIRTSVEFVGGQQQLDEESIMTTLDVLQKKLNWKFSYDNTDNNSGLNNDVASYKVYKYKKLSCAVAYYIDNTIQEKVTVDIHCGGSAMREYF